MSWRKIYQITPCTHAREDIDTHVARVACHVRHEIGCETRQKRISNHLKSDSMRVVPQRKHATAAPHQHQQQQQYRDSSALARPLNHTAAAAAVHKQPQETRRQLAAEARAFRARASMIARTAPKVNAIKINGLSAHTHFRVVCCVFGCACEIATCVGILSSGTIEKWSPSPLTS